MNNNNRSLYIAKYLRKIFMDFNNGKNGVVDLFIETFFDDHDFRESGQIHNITDEFINCVNNVDDYERNKCFEEFKNVRYHYGDIRRFMYDMPINKNDHTYIAMGKSMFDNNNIYVNKLLNDYNNSKDKNQYINEILESIINIPKIKKNIQSITNETISIKMLKFFHLYIKTKLDSFDSNMNPIDIVIILFVPVMDIYLLSRVFKKFDNSMRVNKSGIHQDYANKVIIVAGFRHIENYISVLLNLNYKITFQSSIDEKSQCVNVKNIPSLKGGNLDLENNFNPLSFPNYAGDIKYIEKVAGPHNFTVMTNKNSLQLDDMERTFYLIGDLHSIKENMTCINDNKYIPAFDELDKIMSNTLEILFDKRSKSIKLDIMNEKRKLYNIIRLFNNWQGLFDESILYELKNVDAVNISQVNDLQENKNFYDVVTKISNTYNNIKYNKKIIEEQDKYAFSTFDKPTLTFKPLYFTNFKKN